MCHKLEKGIIDLIGKELYMVCDSFIGRDMSIYLSLDLKWEQIPISASQYVMNIHVFAIVIIDAYLSY